MLKKVAFTTLKRMTMEELKGFGSFEVTFDGEYVGYFVRPETVHIHDQVEAMAVLSEAVRPKDG